MNNAARAIIIENGNLLVMRRDKQGMQYYTLVGGRINDGESPEEAVAREVMEETGLKVTSQTLVYTEKHAAPYNSQFVYVCTVAPHGPIGIMLGSDEEILNRDGMNMHDPAWVAAKKFNKLPFRTPQLQNAIEKALKKGFPKTPTAI